MTLGVRRAALIAVDGGGSKIDAAAIARDGTVLASASVAVPPGRGLEVDLAPLEPAVEAVRRDLGAGTGRALAPLGVYCLSGADLPADERRLRRGLELRSWTTETVLRNDTFAVLRAGTDGGWGVAVVCGFGTNCAAISPGGRASRLPALGPISGDWGGGLDLGRTALWHAVRSRDGRGERTALAVLVPAHFGLRRPRQVTEAIHAGRLAEDRLSELAPVVFEAAGAGDAVAGSILERQADEVAAMSTAAIRRLGMRDLEVPVVLGGGVFRNRYPPFLARIAAGVEAVAPRAIVTILSAPPVVGAALLGLDRIGASGSAKARARAGLTNDRGSGGLKTRAGTSER